VKKPHRALLLLATLLVSGCVSQTLNVVTTSPFEQTQSTLVLGRIVFDPPHAYSGDMREIRKLCHGIARMYGFTIIDGDVRSEGSGDADDQDGSNREAAFQGAAGRDAGFEGEDTREENTREVDLPGSSTLPVIHFYLRDRGYTKEFLTLHSVGVFSEIVAPSGASLYKTYYLKDGTDSLQSLGVVAGILEKTFKALAARMQREDKQLQTQARKKQKLGGQ
jgi:hypothetical protein